ncbi:MAG: WG repeat-containing protein [Mucilaginibacter sp.]
MTFEEAYPFGEKYAIVKEAGKYGVLDKNGNYFLKPAYNKFDYNSEGLVFDNQNQYFSLQNGIFNFLYFYYPIGPQFSVYNKGEKLGLIFQNGKRTKAIYDSIITSGLSDIVLKKNKKIGIIDNKGTVIAPFQYTDYVGDRDLTPYQSEDYSGDRYFHENNMFAVKYKSTWHYYLEGKKLFESNITPYILHYNVIVFQTNDLYNYMDNTGKVVLPENYKWISPSGYVAINKNDEVVLFNNKKEEFIYFKK